MSARQLALRSGFHPSTVSRIESGKRTPTPTVLATLLATLGVVGEDRDRLLRMVDTAAAPQWAATGAGLPHQLTALLRWERRATRVMEVQPLLIPGLLQTSEYAEEVMRVSGNAEESIEAMVAVRLGRQKLLDKGLKFEVIIDESVLMRPLGGAAAMADQCGHLSQEAGRKNVIVRVVPVTRSNIAINGPFSTFEFAEDDPIVHLEHLSSGLFVDDTSEVNVFFRAIDSLREVAMSPQDSVRLIATYQDQHRQTAVTER